MAWTATAVAGGLAHRGGARGSGSVLDDAACLDTAAFRTLAKAPPGLVLAAPNLGPFILATTPDSVLSAPYHRMAWGISAGHILLHLPVAEAEAPVRKLGAAYVAACAAGASGDSLQARLAAKAPPAWLEPLSAPGETLQVYRLRPPAAALRPALG